MFLIRYTFYLLQDMQYLNFFFKFNKLILIALRQISKETNFNLTNKVNKSRLTSTILIEARQFYHIYRKEDYG